MIKPCSFMKFIIHLALIFVMLFSNCLTAGDDHNELNNIRQLQWQNRVLIVWSHNLGKSYQQIHQTYSSQIADRDMAIFIINDTELITNLSQPIGSEFLSHLKLSFPKDRGNYYLVGKDGGIKNKGKPLVMQNIFDQIDQMPMRMLEMQQ